LSRIGFLEIKVTIEAIGDHKEGHFQFEVLLLLPHEERVELHILIVHIHAVPDGSHTPLAAQQAPQVLALPLFGLLVIQETALLAAKLGGVHGPATIHILAWDELVQHLMEDHIFNDIAGHEGLVQEAVDADEPVTFLVGTKADGRALAPGRAATPGNVRLYTIDEVVLIEIMIDRCEVKIAPLWLQ
jgi:hypothetical protein